MGMKSFLVNYMLPHARICDMNRTYVDTGIRPWISENVGIWIDILPCDGISSNRDEAKLYLSRLDYLMRKAYWIGVKNSSWSNLNKGKNCKEKIKFLVKKVIGSFILDDPFEEIYRMRKQFDYETSDYFFATPHYGLGEWQPKKNLDSFILHRFEDHEFYVMSGYDSNLSSLYGDYMKLPSENQRISHEYNRYYWKK